MKKRLTALLLKCSTPLLALALTVATVNANVCCPWLNYQPPVPEDVKKLRKF